METRKLAALLKVLKAFGVTQYRAGDVSLSFGGDSLPLVPAAQPDEADMELPTDVVDPRRKLAEIYRRGRRVS